MRAALFAFSRGGCVTARRVMAALPEATFVCYTMERFEEPDFLPLDKTVYGASFSSMDALIFVAACGIAVREIAPYVKSKKTDPAVVCIDEAGQFVIPLLSGHIGGANALAEKLAEKLDATAVVYKATWPEEHIFRCTVGTLHETVTGNGLTKTSLIVVGNCLGDTYLRSLLYHPNFTTEFRKGAQ